jgi:hypothetical protein
MLTTHRAAAAVSLLFLMLLQGAAFGAAWTTVREAEGAEPAQVEIDGKSRAYWKLEQGLSMELTVTGPAQLRVFSRAPWKRSFKDKPYAWSYRLDDGETEVLRHKAGKARSARLAGGGALLAASRVDEIEIPPGVHVLRITADECLGGALYLRLQRRFVQPIPRGGNIELSPVAPLPVRDVAVRETIARYHVLASGEEAQLDVVGPTFLKLISRLDWNPSMSGRQKYMLRVYLDGEFRNTWVLQGRRSDVAVYTEKSDSVPAQGEVVYVDVPEGRHQVGVRFQDSGRELNLRVLMPRESLRNSD